MHAQYASTVEQIAQWAEADPGIAAAVLVGSQARDFLPADEWADLDALVFARDAAALTGNTAWLARFGGVVCTARETVDLSFAGLVWHASRAIYADGRVIDFNVIPADKLDAALGVNREIHARGFRVLYDGVGNLREKIAASLRDFREEPARVPTKEELDDTVSDLLFHVVWTIKKTRRGEVWTAVRCVNRYMNDLLLRLVEWRNMACGRSAAIRYDGRFLEARTDAETLQGLRDCFSLYDGADARRAALRLLEFTLGIARETYGLLGHALDEGRFAAVRAMAEAMKA